MKLSTQLICLSALFTACESTPPVSSHTSLGPEWTRGSTRLVDNGYIVYVGHSEASRLEDAQFKAEGLALEDLANECSLIPKGVRIEDRYTEAIHTGHSAYVKIALEMQDCEHAAKTNDPAEIKRIANVPMTEQLKKYQDFNEAGPDGEQQTASLEIPPPPEQGRSTDEMHFYVTRQYIAREKEIVILAPPTAFAPGSPESQHFTNTIQPATTHVAGMVQKEPQLARNPTPWSRLPDRPHLTPLRGQGTVVRRPPTSNGGSRPGRARSGRLGHSHRR